MKFPILRCCLLWMLTSVNATKKQIIDEVTICKRNDPDFNNCYCKNFNVLTSLLKDGIPEMNIIPLDPIRIKEIQMFLPPTQSMHFEANLKEVFMAGLCSTRYAVCQSHITSDGVQLYLELYIPALEIRTYGNLTGNFLMFHIDSLGKVHGDMSGLTIKAQFNSTRYMKANKEYLRIACVVHDIAIEKLHVNITDLFENNAEMEANFNAAVHENIMEFYNELKPVIVEIVRSIIQQIVNNFFETFPFDVLFPE